MTDAGRRVSASLGVLAILLAVVARLATSPEQRTLDRAPAAPIAASHPGARVAVDVGEGAERAPGSGDTVPRAVRVTAGRVIAAYRELERRPTSPHALVKLAPRAVGR